MHSYKPQKETMMIYGNTIKEIIKMYPKWLWAGNIFCVALGLWVIFWLVDSSSLSRDPLSKSMFLVWVV